MALVEKGYKIKEEAMAAPDTDLARFVAREIKKYEGIMVPIKAGNAERMFVKKVPIEKLHPNPDDEFCSKTVGPNYSIYNRYVRTFQRFGSMEQSVADEPITVEKMYPDGYMILNGHHRWAAALRVGFKTVPVKIVNLTNEVDIMKMLQASNHDKRAALDLDEVIFCSQADDVAEKPLPFPLNKIYVERIRLGIPALMHYLSRMGYDIWVYTSEYYSLDYIRRYFRQYSVRVCGIFTGTGRKTKSFSKRSRESESRITHKYRETIHIGRDLIFRMIREEGILEEHEIQVDPEDWSRRVIGIIRKWSKTN